MRLSTLICLKVLEDGVKDVLAQSQGTLSRKQQLEQLICLMAQIKFLLMSKCVLVPKKLFYDQSIIIFEH